MLQQAFSCWRVGAWWGTRRMSRNTGPTNVWRAWWSGWRLPFRRGKPAPAKASGADRRTSIRYGISLETSGRLIASIEDDPLPLRVRNISAGGISLVLHRGVEPDTVIEVQLLNRPQMFLCVVQVRVTYIVEHPSGDWILGGAFVRKLTDEEVRLLLA